MRDRKILYFGLDPARYRTQAKIVHCPLIDTKPRPYEWVKPYFSVFHTHVLFTSRSAVSYYFAYRKLESLQDHMNVYQHKKVFICIGQATADRLADFGIQASDVAQQTCAEGVLALLEQQHTMSCILYPHSARSRYQLPHYLRFKGIPFVLYDTYFRSIDLPDLACFDRLVFTSPSTVEAFSLLTRSLPPLEKCEAIGPITQKALNKLLS